METKRSFFQFIKFAIVGAMNTIVDFLVYTVLTLVFGVNDNNVFLVGLFTLIAYACGVLNSFILNTHWTFKSEYRQTSREKILFIVVNLVSWLVSFALTYLFTEFVFDGSGIAQWVANLLHYQQMDNVVSILAKLLAAPIVIIINFLGSKLLVFRSKNNDR